MSNEIVGFGTRLYAAKPGQLGQAFLRHLHRQRRPIH
jgi:hypothetical protein